MIPDSCFTMGRQPSIVFTRPLIGLSILAQWPLCAALARPLGQSPFTTVNGVCVLLALASLGLWLLGCRPQGFGRIALLQDNRNSLKLPSRNPDNPSSTR